MSKRIDKKKAKKIAKEHGYLQYMIERYLALWGEAETLRFIQACEIPVRTSIRVNTLKTSNDELQEHLQKRGVSLENVPWLEEGFFADFSRYSPGSLFEHMMGHYYVQGVPSMTVVRALDPLAEEIVFDLASAPGGKTTHIAQRMENSGLVIAIESDRQRINSLESNILRCGVTNSLIMRGDVRKLEQLEIIPDKILLDAPCSGEGLIALDPSRKTSKTMADIRYCATRQDEMIEAALNILPAGGTLVYSTCSIAPEENEFVIDALLRKREDFKLSPIELNFGIPAYTEPYGIQLHKSLELARRFLPQKHGLEGLLHMQNDKGGNHLNIELADTIEWASIVKHIDDNFGQGVTRALLGNRTPVTLQRRDRKSFYLIPVDWVKYIEMDTGDFDIRYLGIWLGEIVKEQFRLSISVLEQLSQLTSSILTVSHKGAQSFTYGRGILKESVQDLPKGLVRGQRVIIVNTDGKSLGLGMLSVDSAKLDLLAKDRLVAKNLADIGWYIRRFG